MSAAKSLLTRVLPATVACSIALAGCGKGTDSAAAKAAVTLTKDSCPSLTVKAGATTFNVTNKNANATDEFEILNGKKIVGEIEGVTPGLTRSFTKTYSAGVYTTYCPHAKTEKGTLTVTR